VREGRRGGRGEGRGKGERLERGKKRDVKKEANALVLLVCIYLHFV
jgi:hypothetical protein